MDDTTFEASGMKELAEYSAEQSQPTLVNVHDKYDAVVLPDGKSIQSLKSIRDQYLNHPERRTDTVTLDELQSFNDYIKRYYSEKNTAIFASFQRPSDQDDTPKMRMVGVLDYHDSGYEGDANWCNHRAIYDFPLSESFLD